MPDCPRCGRHVDTLHPVPPAAITRGVFEEIGNEDTQGDLRACRDCVNELMEGPATD